MLLTGGRPENNGDWLDGRRAQLKGRRRGCRPGQRKVLGLDVRVFLKGHRLGRRGALAGCCVKVKLWDGLGEASAWFSSQARERVGNCSTGFAEGRASRWRSVRLQRSAGLESLCRDSEETLGIPGCPRSLWLHSSLALWLFLAPCDVILRKYFTFSS